MHGQRVHLPVSVHRPQVRRSLLQLLSLLLCVWSMLHTIATEVLGWQQLMCIRVLCRCTVDCMKPQDHPDGCTCAETLLGDLPSQRQPGWDPEAVTC